ncbi:T9SS type A sorting domain-containing protein [Flavobacterium sp.]|jgi:hypothetical protein|uniref:T9SS type A sorting domain-containing protein n=1 Tax=Flavobacterium sp. TaxID=239 RepID=UPI0037C0EE23
MKKLLNFTKSKVTFGNSLKGCTFLTLLLSFSSSFAINYCSTSIGTGNYVTTLTATQTGPNQTTIVLGSQVDNLGTAAFNIQSTAYSSYNYTTSPYGVIINWPGAPPTSFNIYFFYSTAASGASSAEYLISSINGQNSCLPSPTLTNFTVGSKLVGDADFNITPPTSNSTGTFTYTSSNTNVATIVNGNQIHVVGFTGTSTITANQAASASYSAGSTTATLTVTSPNPAPSLGTFTVGPKLSNDANFTITPPTTNSTGTFSYTSSNTAVATIVNGNQIDVLTAGTTIITAIQSYDANYTAGSATATLTVTDPTPGASPIPPVRNSLNASSVFSDAAYPLVVGTRNYNPNWGQAGSASLVSIGGNDVWRAINLNYQGITFGSNADLSTMTHFHVDVWTINETSLQFFLIDNSAGERSVSLANYSQLTQGSWISYDIPMTAWRSQSGFTTAALKEFKIVGSGGKTVYMDNMYFYKQDTWSGSTNTAWATTSNWASGAVPTATSDVVIATGTNQPFISSDVSISSLTINSGTTLTVNAGKKLTLSGNLTNNGTINFKSDVNGTAMFGVFNGTQSGTGVVTVERFIPSGKRAFRLLSPAVTTTTFISGNWQGQTHITGGLGTTGLGFDVTETNNPSMFTYNNQVASGSGWTPIANTNATNLTAGVGYRMLVRGDRTPTNITAATTDNMNAAITLSATGTLKTGTVTLNASSTPAINNTANTTTANYSLVGNPYQSAVDWNAVTKSGIDATYWAWDPNMGTTAQRGRYVAFNGTTNDNVDSEVEQFIQPGQAFFVKNTTSGTAGSLTFEEADKATTSANVFRTNNQTESTNFATLSMQLYDPNELAIGGYPIDATKAVFSSEYTNELGLGDATKLEAAGENIAWFRNNTKLAIDAAAPVTTSDELAMKTLRLVANKNYTFKIQTTNFDTALTPYLVDTFLNTQTEIATSQAYLATFATTSNVASYNENRFKIVFQNALLSTDTFATQVGLYPNPSKGNGFYLQLTATTQATVKLYNTLGQEIAISHNEGNYQAKQSLAAGVYHIMVTQGEKTSKLKWIVE